MDQSIAAAEQPRYIKLNERDNVAIVVNDFGLPAGSQFSCGLQLRAFVPQGHKTALVDIEKGAPILRYGEIIGHALSPILAGRNRFADGHRYNKEIGRDGEKRDLYHL